MARQNALLGIHVAMGELQRLTGADQRITATADILSTDNIGQIAASDKKRWTGVWDSTIADPDIGFLGWLVSGANTSGTIDVREACIPLTAQAGSELITLLGQASANNTDTNGNTLDNHVQAATVNILSANGSTTGSYAYWVSDEGVKARINLPDNFADTAPNQVNEDILTNSLRFSQPIKTELRAIDNTLSHNPSNLAFSDQLKRVSTFSTAKLLGNDIKDFLLANYHDVTTSSVGLFTNVRDGGLMKDLSRGLDEQWDSSDLKDQPMITYGDTEGPQWNLMREYFNQYQNLSDRNTSNPGITPYAPTRIDGSNLNSTDYFDGSVDKVPTFSGATANNNSATIKSQGMHPILIRAAVKAFPVSKASAGLEIEMRLFAYFTLWNPYNAALQSSNYRIAIDTDDQDFEIKTADDTASINILEYSFFENNRSLESERWSSTEKKELDLNFDTGAISFTPGEIIMLGLDLDEDIPYSSGMVYQLGSALFAPDPEDLNAKAITFSFPIADPEFGPEDFYEILWRRKVVSGESVSNDNHKWRIDLYLGSNELIQSVEQLTFHAAPHNPDGFRTVGRHEGSDNDYLHPIGPDFSLRNTINYFNLSYSTYPPFSYFNPRAAFSTGAHSIDFYFRSFYRDGNQLWWEGGFTQWEPSHFHLPALSDNTAAAWGTDYRSKYISPQPYPIPTRIIAFDVPRTPPLSLGAFQHAPLNSLSSGPAYPIGNSLAPVWNTDEPEVNATVGTANDLDQVDLSYELNSLLWDQFFISGIPSDENLNAYPTYDDLPAFDLDYLNNGGQLANPRIHYVQPKALSISSIDEVRDYDLAAASLLNKGAFNINSTSVNAWKSVLTALARQSIEVYDWHNNDSSAIVSEDNIGYPIPRLSYPASLPDQDLNNKIQMNNDGDTNYWNGFRSLTQDELNRLAEQIVAVIKRRGPFQSIADFVNREVGGSGDRALRGTLEQAILEAQINEPDPDGLVSSAGRPDMSYFGSFDSSSSGYHNKYHKVIDWGGTHQPGWVSQADVLQLLGPIIQARSDTFVIRSYGDVRDPITEKITARVWCEATVQRTPDLVPSSGVNPNDPNQIIGNATGLGRQFRLVSLRWLTEDEV